MRTDISDFVSKLTAAERRHHFALEAYGKAAGNKMNNYAKANHPWHNRSKNCQNGMQGVTEWQGPYRLKVGLFAREEYAWYLERRNFPHAGRLETWWPTIQRFKPEVLRGWAQAVSK